MLFVGLINVIKGEQPVFFPLKMLVEGEALDKGNIGEYLIDYALSHGSIAGEKKIYRNLLVPRRGATDASEVDVLMVHERGIYVFESKNYSGWIFGSADQLRWTASLNKATKERFYNPVRQNRGHVDALASVLGLPEEAFVSFIVFSERCELKAVPDDTESVIICRRHHLVRDVERSLERREFSFDEKKLDGICDMLDGLAKASTAEARNEHAAQAKAVAEGTVCPYCGSNLVERRRKSDGNVFIGCSAFPKCRYTRSGW